MGYLSEICILKCINDKLDTVYLAIKIFLFELESDLFTLTIIAIITGQHFNYCSDLLPAIKYLDIIFSSVLSFNLIRTKILSRPKSGGHIITH